VARIEDLAIDQLGRVHALFIAGLEDREVMATAGVVGNGDVVLDPTQPDLFCQTVNVFVRDPQTGSSQVDRSYPFQVRDPQSGRLLPSPSTRVLSAGGGDIWLFGSDGGVARVADSFRGGECREGRVAVHYDPIFRREASGLLANTVPALVVGADGALWFGTALGVTRFQNGQFTPVPFDPALSLRGQPATLEAFFQAVAQAIFEAQPLSAVRLGGVSFVDAFGAPVVKEDLIFSAVADGQGRLWVGTLGGGIRRIDASGGALRDTLHLTRQEGLGSNLILALAAGPDGSIWAGTDEGVSRIEEVNGALTITNFTALDGLAVPVRDVAVRGDGTVWLATDGGLFRLTTTVGLLRGVVRDAAGRPVAGAIVTVLGTRFHTVTDAQGRFVLANLPPGVYQLLVDGSVVARGPFTATVVKVTLGEEERQLEPVVVVPRSRAARLVARGGDGQTGAVGRPLPDPLVVAAQDEEGRGIAGAPVTFTVAAGGAAFDPALVVTDPAGLAATTVTPTAAGPIRVAARADGEAVVFTLTGVGAGGGGPGIEARLILVSGNNQTGQPGQVLPAPLVVRLEDQFRRPLPGQPVTAEVVRGEGTPIPVSCQDGRTPVATAMTDALGRACFQLRTEAGSEEDIVVRVSALGQTVQFLGIVGSVDTPDIPRDLAVAGNIVYIADRFSGLQIVDVSDSTHPRQLQLVQLEGSEERLALAGNRLYVATDFPPPALCARHHRSRQACGARARGSPCAG
jgi:Carboxypeptidase regulatory-like domain/LVIVD repeat